MLDPIRSRLHRKPSWLLVEPRARPRHLVVVDVIVLRVSEPAFASDAAWFDELVERMTPSLFRLAYVILRDESQAGDAVQDAWLAAWRKRADLHAAARVEPWVHRILVNTCRMTLRHRRRHPVVGLIEVAGHIGATDPELTAVQRDSLERLFATLAGGDRALLVLHYVYNRPLADISIALGVPEGTVKSRLHRVRGTLKEALREQDDADS